ncbi:MAG: YdcF family protein, partial [Bifidobacteriaceae bacterium]|nr:YdcF family protein [Bifidobacteriaceae bacterium]
MRGICWTVVGLVVAAAVVVGGLNALVCGTTKRSIVSAADAAKVPADAILVLGAGIVGTQPSPMLASRLDTAIDLYRRGAAPVLLMSGDNSTPAYSEVDVMERYAVAKGVPKGDIYLDHAGFSTYESAYRAEAVFKAKRVIVVTQRYHLYRALWDAKHLGLAAVGLAAAPHNDATQRRRDLREAAARVKDPFCVWTHRKPTFLGPVIRLVPGDAPTGP